MNNPITDPQQIKLLIDSVDNWYHKIELAPGIVTPGIRDCNAVLSTLNLLGLPKNCQSLRVLDIGCRDGFFAFEMEARGAEVIAIDYAGVDVTGFSVVSQIKNSKVKYFTDNVYKLDPKKYGVFDIVLFLGVLYHLRNPMLALDQIQQLIKPDGLLLVETQIATNPKLLKINVPAWQFYPGKDLNNDATNKWAPNISGFKAIIEETQFKILNDAVYDDRAYIIAKAEKDLEKEYYSKLDSSTGLIDKEQTGFFGGIDEVTPTSIAGWVINLANPEDQIVVMIWQNDQLIAAELANMYRSDLKEAGYGDGKHGFAIKLQLSNHEYPLSVTIASSKEQAFPDSSSYWNLTKEAIV